MYFQGFTSAKLGLWSILPMDTPKKNPKDPMWFEPWASKLKVIQFTTKPSYNMELIYV